MHIGEILNKVLRFNRNFYIFTCVQHISLFLNSIRDGQDNEKIDLMVSLSVSILYNIVTSVSKYFFILTRTADVWMT